MATGKPKIAVQRSPATFWPLTKKAVMITQELILSNIMSNLYIACMKIVLINYLQNTNIFLLFQDKAFDKYMG